MQQEEAGCSLDLGIMLGDHGRFGRFHGQSLSICERGIFHLLVRLCPVPSYGAGVRNTGSIMDCVINIAFVNVRVGAAADRPANPYRRP